MQPVEEKHLFLVFVFKIENCTHKIIIKNIFILKKFSYFKEPIRYLFFLQYNNMNSL